MPQAVAVSTAVSPLVEPPRLRPGARVALISPSGPLRDVTELTCAEGHARVFGWETIVGPHAMGRMGYFAGTDEQRAADLISAIADPSIDGIWCLRGGYGAARLLPMLNLETITAQPKALIGYSDITALHAAWWHAGVTSYHGPTGRGALTMMSRDSLSKAVILGANSAGQAPESTVMREGCATGRLVVGNLALLASLVGTPWAIDFRDAIVVLEDIGEATYRIDRMLTQLRQSGAFDGCAGLAFGQFTHCSEHTDDGERSLESVLREFVDIVAVPALLGIPCGHIDNQWTLPLGAMATLDATQKTLHVTRGNAPAV